MAISNEMIAAGYVFSCCVTLSEQAFSSILDQNVTLNHVTQDLNDLTFVNFTSETGAKKVLELFKKYLFDNTSNMSMLKYHIDPMGEKMAVSIVIEEDKKEADHLVRYRFQESTILGFTPEHKIASIFTNVFRERIS